MANHFQPADSGRYAAALERFEQANRRDPNQERVGAVAEPREVVYAAWLTQKVLELCPEASEELRLAAHCQHLCRWMLPRDSYPATRQGYLQWREALKCFHASKAGEILAEVGYPPSAVLRVQELNLKKNFPRDPESRVLEDALCLVFLERQFQALAAKSSEEKVINALRKAWSKMTPLARAAALRIAYGPREKQLLDKALQSAV